MRRNSVLARELPLKRSAQTTLGQLSRTRLRLLMASANAPSDARYMKRFLTRLIAQTRSPGRLCRLVDEPVASDSVVLASANTGCRSSGRSNPSDLSRNWLVLKGPKAGSCRTMVADPSDSSGKMCLFNRQYLDLETVVHEVITLDIDNGYSSFQIVNNCGVNIDFTRISVRSHKRASHGP